MEALMFDTNNTTTPESQEPGQDLSHSLIRDEVTGEMREMTWQELGLNDPADTHKRVYSEQHNSGAIAQASELVERYQANKGMVKDAIPENAKVISTGYKARPLQAKLHRSLNRFNVLVCHRRFGKTVFAINELIDQAIRNPLHNPHYAYIAPTYGQAKKIAWDYIKEFANMIPGYEAREGDLAINIFRQEIRDKDGTLIKPADKITIWLLSAENPDSLRGLYLDGVILDEYGDMNPVIWTQVIRPALSDRFTESLKIEGCPRQGWAIFIGTPKGQNHFYERHEFAIENPKNWYGVIYKASETDLIHKEELDDAKAEMSDDEYNQEYECDFNAAMTGAYFSKFMINAEEEGRIGDFPYIPGQGVATFWDLGIADSMAIWFVQKVGSKYRVIDYLEEHGKGMDFYLKELQNRPYIYSRHHFPHDANNRELISGTARIDTLRTMGFYPADVVPKVHLKADAIHAVRMKLPLCEFNLRTCQQGINALRNYQRDWDPKHKIFKKNPKHDWSSHGSDAFQTFARGVNEHLSFVMFGEWMGSSEENSEADTDYNPHEY
jgi:hypothetical protein